MQCPFCPLLPAGLNIAGSIEAPGYLEGGDFFPVASRDLSLVGIGLRSNMEACQQLMDQDLLGTARLGVVRDDFDRNQVSRTYHSRQCRERTPGCVKAVVGKSKKRERCSDVVLKAANQPHMRYSDSI